MTAPTPLPAWTSTFYDSVGQVPTLGASPSADGRNVEFTFDRFVVDLQGDDTMPSAGSAGLSGAVTFAIPDDLDIAGLLLYADGFVTRSAGTQLAMTVSIGSATRTKEWPLLSVAGNPAPGSGTTRTPSSGSDATDPEPTQSFDDDFRLECFVSDFSPSTVGVAPFPPFPAVPVTLAVQARRRAVDEFVHIDLTAFSVVVLTS